MSTRNFYNDLLHRPIFR